MRCTTMLIEHDAMQGGTPPGEFHGHAWHAARFQTDKRIINAATIRLQEIMDTVPVAVALRCQKRQKSAPDRASKKGIVGPRRGRLYNAGVASRPLVKCHALSLFVPEPRGRRCNVGDSITTSTLLAKCTLLFGDDDIACTTSSTSSFFLNSSDDKTRVIVARTSSSS